MNASRIIVCSLFVACGDRSDISRPDNDRDAAPISDATPIVDVVPSMDAPPIPIQGCSRLVLADSVAETRIAFDSEYVYFASPGSSIGNNQLRGAINRAAKTGGAVQLIATDTIQLPYFISNLVVDGAWIYWSSSVISEIHRAPKSGGAVSTIPCQITRYGSQGSVKESCFRPGYATLPIAIAGTDIFVGSHGEVLRLPIAGGEATVAAIFDVNGGSIQKPGRTLQIEIRDSRIVWNGEGVLFASDLDGSNGFHVGDTVREIAIDSSRIYWAYAGNTLGVQSTPTKGTGIATDEKVPPFAMTTVFDADETTMYTYASDGIHGTSKSDGTTKVLVPKTMTFPSMIRVDDCLYYAGEGGRLIRTEKH